MKRFLTEFGKKMIKKMLPEAFMWEYQIFRQKIHSKRSYLQIEEIVDSTYYKIMGRHIKWDSPTSFTEKITISKVYGASALKTGLTDKVAVRKWVADKIGEKYLVPLIGVYDSMKEVPFDDLPERFVIKCSHDSASATVIDEKSRLQKKDITRLKKKYDHYYLKRDFGWLLFEMHYLGIPPKIVIEKSLGKNINDYKFLCWRGRPYYVWVDVDRFTEHKRNVYDLFWKLQPFTICYSNSKEEVKKPAAFQEMLEVVQTLCQGFDFVRVDLYEVNGKVYFGEMTFTSDAGIGRVEPQEWDDKLGALWKFDDVLKARQRKIGREK